MPRFDSTGPNGQGPLTGRKKGKCGYHKSKGFKDTINEQEIENNVGKGLQRNRRRFRYFNS